MKNILKKISILFLTCYAPLAIAQHKETHALFSLNGMKLETIIDSTTEIGMTGERYVILSGDKEIAKRIITHQNLDDKKHPVIYLKEMLGKPDPESEPKMAKLVVWTNKKTGVTTSLTYWEYMGGAIYKREDRKFIDKNLNGAKDIYGDFEQVVLDKKLLKVWEVSK